MPELPSSNPRQFVQGAPVLHVPDVMGTAAFYRDVLGFTWDFGDDIYAVVWRDNSAIHFVKDNMSPRGIHLFQWGERRRRLLQRDRRSRASIAKEPTNQPYGIREFGLSDVNGVSIVFGQEIERG